MTKVSVELTFPLGAHFYQNIYLSIYRQLIHFIHRLNCIAPSNKCYDCPLSQSCRYYHCTGNNFKDYPGILIHNPIFPKSIYVKEENLLIEFYLIGEMDQYQDYINLFFESYLNQSLNQNVFYLKRINVSHVDSKIVNIEHLKLTTLVESTDILDVYNQMVNHYNKHYGCYFAPIQGAYQITFQKKVSFDDFSLKTKRIHPKGYVYRVDFENPVAINQAFFETGIGKYNFIGGGYIANENYSK